MNKANVELIVPTIQEKYEVFIPINKRIKEIIILVNKVINEITDGQYPVMNNLSLINGETGKAFDYNKTAKEEGIINGIKIILM
ncbi:MAG: hypothetical protein Q4G04_00160 [bacterium]|nr:hypothetical protein [bacterium]